MEEPRRKRPYNTNEIALSSFESALNQWRKAPVPASVLQQPIKKLGFHDDLSEYLDKKRGIRTGYALRQADPRELVEHFRGQMESGKIGGGNLVVFAGKLRQYLKNLPR